MLSNGLWEHVTDALMCTSYNFDAMGALPTGGHLHTLLKTRTELRQQHPARGAHDIFFINNPAKSSSFPADHLERVKKVHLHGGYGSHCYGYDWKLQEAQKNLQRTHTTEVCARMLYKLVNKPSEGFKPAKYFSINKVFRNETLDATHLAEFHQVEGVTAAVGALSEFFRKLCITQLEFFTQNPAWKYSVSISFWANGLRWAMPAFFVLKCCYPWACLKM